MSLIRYHYRNPLAHRSSLFAPVSEFEREIDRLVHSAFSNAFPQVTINARRAYPAVDLYEDKDHLFFRAELPGLDKKDIHVELTDGVLTLSGERKSFGKDGEEKTSSKFSRSVSVPTKVEQEKISAAYENGVLTVTLPKAEEVKPKRVAIEVK